MGSDMAHTWHFQFLNAFFLDFMIFSIVDFLFPVESASVVAFILGYYFYL